jgi:uncharacterized membrane protein
VSVTFTQAMEDITRAFEVAGVAVLSIGALAGFVGYVVALARGGGRAAFRGLRENLGRAIILGLEILIISDIIRTITIEQSIESAISLGVVVLVRTFLSFSLEIELEGVVPWRRRAAGGHRDGADGGD